jgi:electron transfer flavoprotein alpha subunit
MSTHNGILVCTEVLDGNITTVSKEVLSIAVKLGSSREDPLGALVLGQDVEQVAKEVIAHGADKVYLVQSSSFKEQHPEHYAAIITKVCRELMPSIVLLGHTDIGRDVAPRVAARLGASVTMDCTELAEDADTQQLLITKPVYGGNAMAVWVSDSDAPEIITMRPRSNMPEEPDSSRRGQIIRLNHTLEIGDVQSELLETVKPEMRGVQLDEAEVVIAGGGGIGGRDGFTLLEEAADVMGGCVGVTRVPCDEGWMPVSLEIGQTGHMVSPKLYVAIGISGAAQHMAGCSGSKCIVAINKDPDAHIFKLADFGLVGDYREILPPLIDTCRTLVE